MNLEKLLAQKKTTFLRSWFELVIDSYPRATVSGGMSRGMDPGSVNRGPVQGATETTADQER